MKHRTIVLVAPLLLVGAALVCLLVLPSVAAVTPSGVTEPVTIVYWHQHTTFREEFLQALVDEFNATNSYSITVEMSYQGGYSEIYDTLIAALTRGGPLPNVIPAYPNQLADYARFGAVRFLDDYLYDPVLGIPDVADFYPGMFDYYQLPQYGHQLAALQNGRSIELVYYNADLLAAVGQEVPATWDAFEAACIAVTSDTVSGTIVGTDASRFATWLWSRGGELLSDDGTSARFYEQPGIDSLRLFQRLIAAGAARPIAEMYEDQTAFGNGETVFTFGSSSGIPYYRIAMDAGAGDAWGVTHSPALPGHEVVDAYGAGLGVLRESEAHDRAAWLFIRWLAEREQAARWAALSGYFPVRISAMTHPSMTEKLASDPQYAQAHALLPLSKGEPGVRHYEQVRRIIGNAVGEVFINGASVTTTLEAAAAEVDALLAGTAPMSALIPPDGGTLVYSSTHGISTTVEFPSGALPTTTTVTYVPLQDLPTDGLAFALLPNMHFSRPVTVTLHYRDTDIAGLDEQDLEFFLYDWHLGWWVDAEPCGGYVRDPLNNRFQAAVCHFSDYALMNQRFRVHLPLVVRASW